MFNNIIFVNYLKLVVRNTTVGKSPLAVATVITQDHSTTSITRLSQRFCFVYCENVFQCVSVVNAFQLQGACEIRRPIVTKKCSLCTAGRFNSMFCKNLYPYTQMATGKFELRVLIRYFWKGGLSTRDAQREICDAEGEETVSHMTVARWLFQHDNAKPHAARRTTKKFEEFDDVETLPHPATVQTSHYPTVAFSDQCSTF